MKMEPIIFWIGLIILFLIVEIITVGLTSIWFAGGALAAVIAERAGGPIWLQVVLFFAVSFVLLYFTRPWAMKFVKPKNVKTNYEEVEGKTVRVTRRVDNIAGTGTVVYNGMEWSARAAEDGSVFEEGELAEVTEVHGVKLILKKVEKV